MHTARRLLRRRSVLAAVTGSVVACVGLVGLPLTASADTAEGFVDWQLSGYPFSNLGTAHVPAWSTADAGPNGTLIVQTVDEVQEWGPQTTELRVGFQPRDASIRPQWTEIGTTASFGVVAADEATGDAALLYWEKDGSTSDDGDLMLTTSYGSGWSPPRALIGSGGGSPTAALLPGLAVGGGRVHVAVTTPDDGLHVFSGTLDGTTLDRTALDTAEGITYDVYPGLHGSWHDKHVHQTHAPRLDAAPDGSAHVVWTSHDAPGASGDETSLAVRSVTGTTWEEPQEIAGPVGADHGGLAVGLLHDGDRLLAVSFAVTGTHVHELTAAGASQGVRTTEALWPIRTNEPTMRADALWNSGPIIPDPEAPGGIVRVDQPDWMGAFEFPSMARIGDDVWLAHQCTGSSGDACAARWDPQTESWTQGGELPFITHHQISLIADTQSIGGVGAIGRVGTRVHEAPHGDGWNLALQVLRRIVPGSTVTATATTTTTATQTVAPTATETTTITASPTSTPTTTVTETATPTHTPTHTVTHTHTHTHTAQPTSTPTVTSVVTVTAPPPPAPVVAPPVAPVAPRPVRDLRARTKKNGDVVVRWIRSSTADGYTLRVNNGRTRTVTGTTWVHRSAENGEKYRYVVRATNDAGSSKPRAVKHRA